MLANGKDIMNYDITQGVYNLNSEDGTIHRLLFDNSSFIKAVSELYLVPVEGATKKVALREPMMGKDASRTFDIEVETDAELFTIAKDGTVAKYSGSTEISIDSVKGFNSLIERTGESGLEETTESGDITNYFANGEHGFTLSSEE